jgi:hypothetical protein
MCDGDGPSRQTRAIEGSSIATQIVCVRSRTSDRWMSCSLSLEFAYRMPIYRVMATDLAFRASYHGLGS